MTCSTDLNLAGVRLFTFQMSRLACNLIVYTRLPAIVKRTSLGQNLTCSILL